jgi:hypothetical protein
VTFSTTLDALFAHEDDLADRSAAVIELRPNQHRSRSMHRMNVEIAIVLLREAARSATEDPSDV